VLCSIVGGISKLCIGVWSVGSFKKESCERAVKEAQPTGGNTHFLSMGSTASTAGRFAQTCITYAQHRPKPGASTYIIGRLIVNPQTLPCLKMSFARIPRLLNVATDVPSCPPLTREHEQLISKCVKRRLSYVFVRACFELEYLVSKYRTTNLGRSYLGVADWVQPCLPRQAVLRR
jgi:hypothetical protein